MRINEVEIYISNYEKTVSFYKDILMFNCLTETAETTSFHLPSFVIQAPSLYIPSKNGFGFMGLRKFYQK